MWDLKWWGVLGSLVLGEENPRTPGDKNSKPVGGGAAGWFFVSGEKEWVFRVFVFFLNLSTDALCPSMSACLFHDVHLIHVIVHHLSFSVKYFLIRD